MVLKLFAAVTTHPTLPRGHTAPHATPFFSATRHTSHCQPRLGPLARPQMSLFLEGFKKLTHFCFWHGTWGWGWGGVDTGSSFDPLKRFGRNSSPPWQSARPLGRAPRPSRCSRRPSPRRCGHRSVGHISVGPREVRPHRPDRPPPPSAASSMCILTALLASLAKYQLRLRPRAAFCLLRLTCGAAGC